MALQVLIMNNGTIYHIIFMELLERLIDWVNVRKVNSSSSWGASKVLNSLKKNFGTFSDIYYMLFEKL